MFNEDNFNNWYLKRLAEDKLPIDLDLDSNGNHIVDWDILYEGNIYKAHRFDEKNKSIHCIPKDYPTGIVSIPAHKVSIITQLQQYQREWLDMMLEFDNSSERITTETSIPMDMISTFILFTRMGYKPKKGKWIFFDCDKCRVDHGDKYIHASLVSHKDLEGVI